MSTTEGGMASRIVERLLSFLAIALVVALGVWVYRLGPDGRQAVWSAAWRGVVWLAIVAAAPWSGRVFIRRLLEMGSNWAPLAFLGVVLIADVMVGVLLLTAWPASAWGWLLALGALGVAGSYNYLVAAYLADEFGA
jgi:hypothetical protein